MTSPWLGIGLILAVLGGLMGGLRYLQYRYAPHPEWVRKMLHVGMGLVTLTLPYLFDQTWPVILLGVLATAGLLAVRLLGALRRRVGGVIGGVARDSLGEIFFPVSIALLFALTQRESNRSDGWVLYCIPILLLTLADAAAALVGVHLGRHRYPCPDGLKSVEGSLTCFVVALPCVFVPLVACGTVDAGRAILIALLLACLVAMIEAIGWVGLDNLLVPLSAYLLLQVYLLRDAAELANRLIVTAALTGFALGYRGRTTLVGSALAASVWVGYLSWALGGWLWLLPPLLVFCVYALLAPRRREVERDAHGVDAVLCVSSAGLAWLFLSRLLDRPDFLLPFALAFAAQLAVLALARLHRPPRRLSGPLALLIGMVEGWLLAVPMGWLAVGSEAWLLASVAGMVGVAVAALAFYLTQPGLEDCPCDGPRWLRQAASVGLGSAFGLLPLAGA